LFCLFQ